MDPKLPTWLNDAFLASALQGGKDKEPRVSVKKYSAELAVPPGNNYTSQILRIKVEYKIKSEEKSRSLIIKAPITNLTASIGDLYNKEPAIYNEFLPVVKKIGFQFCPESFYTSIPGTLVMEDLKEGGYRLCDRYKQLDLNHCEEVLKTLAKFHAASVVCSKNHPEVIELVGKEGLYVDGPQFNQGVRIWFQGALSEVAGIVGKMGLGKAAEDLFNSMVDTALDSHVRLCKPRTSGLNVLNHGDLWTCNILFKHADAGGIEDLKFVDFQATKFTSPVMDLINFIWTSANGDVRGSRLKELCEIYRCTLNSTLDQLGCKERFTVDQMREDFKDAIDSVFVTVCTLLPVQLSEEKDVVSAEGINLEDFQGSAAMFQHLFQGKHFQALLPELVKHIMNWVSYYR